MKKILPILALTCCAALHSASSAATVSCMFLSETRLTTSGEWLKTETDLMQIMQMFGDGLKIPLQNSLLGKLDSQTPFFAGNAQRGRVFLSGSSAGVKGKLINVSGGIITIYEGLCDVSFG